MGDGIIVRPLEVGDPRPGPHTGADGAAVGGQAADSGLLVDGHQVTDQKRPVELLLGGPQMLGVADHRQRGCNPLVARTGIDDHRHLTAAHAGVAARGGPGLGLHPHIVAVGLQQSGADVGAPVVPEPLLGNGAVILDLPLQQPRDPGQLHGTGEVQDVPQIEDALVGQTGLGGVFQGLLQQPLPVLFNAHNVAVVVGNMDHGAVSSGPAGETDVQHPRCIRADQFNRSALHIGGDLLVAPGRDGGDDLQLPVGLAGHNAHRDGSFDPLQAAGIGHHHALDVLDDVAGDLRPHPFRLGAQHLAQLGRSIGHGGGLGTAGGRYQLLV